jgi:hypothetical protein
MNRSTYGLLVRSEEKNRGFLETAVYLLLILSAAVSIWQFASQALPSTSAARHNFAVAHQPQRGISG